MGPVIGPDKFIVQLVYVRIAQVKDPYDLPRPLLLTCTDFIIGYCMIIPERALNTTAALHAKQIDDKKYRIFFSD